MVNIKNKLQGCPVIIFDDANNIVTKTVVESHSKNTTTIEVSDKLDMIELGTRVHLLVIHSGGASEFDGVASCSYNGLREINIYAEKRREARASIRHRLNAPAVVTRVIAGTVQDMNSSPLQVTIENISSSGMLLNAPYLDIELNQSVEANTNINGRDVVLFGKVVRKQLKNNGNLGLGCKFVFSD